MGNCWRMPEDYFGFVDVPINHFTPISLTSTAFEATPTSNLTHSVSTTSDVHRPKLVILSRTSADINAIKAAQCRNLVEHLPVVNYDETLNKQTECDICLVDFMPNEQVRKLPCDGAHVFHPSCIDSWFTKSLTCPHCSTNVDAVLLLRFIPKSSENDEDEDE